MAIKFIPAYQEYIGLSGDSKLGITQDGSIIYYTDTKKREICNNGSWTEYTLNTDTVLKTADIEIGAVELKNSTDDTRATVGANGLYVDIRNIQSSLAATFHTTATIAANGTTVDVLNYKTLLIEIYGTSTSRTITFYGAGNSNTLRTIQGIRLSDLSLASSTTGTGELWQFDVTGLDHVVMDLTAVAGGNVSIVGKLVM